MPDQPTPTVAAALAELASMKRIVAILDRLDAPAQARVLRWLTDAYQPARVVAVDQLPGADREDVTR
jgi:hypothetical protein